VGYLGTVTDITERKQAELLERDRNRVLEMVSQNKPLKLVLAALIQLVEGQHPELLSSVLLLQDGRVYHAAAPNLPESFTRIIDGLTFGDILGTGDTVVYRGETLITPNIATELEKSTYHKLALRYDLRAYWSVPIFSSDGALLGIFTSYYRQPNRPTPEELQLVGMASQLAAIALEHHQLTEQLAYQAQHDALTGLPNRPLFEDRLHQAIARARRSGSLVGLLYVDLDRFKLVNDTLGHAAGDTLLRQVAQRLKSCVREGDMVARIGGDEFSVVLNDLENPQDAEGVIQRILETLKQPLVLRGHELFVTTSIGISLYPTDGDEAEELLRKADNALYRGKQQGRNTYQFYTPEIDEAVHEHFRLKYHLQGAIERGELLLYYQPQFKVTSGELVGLEALLRWNHPELGLISPNKFISLAEESGLIVPFGAWVLAEACRQNQFWQQAGYPALRMAINVSILQFTRANFVETVVQALEQVRLDPKWLQLELTESLLMRNPKDTASKLSRLRTLGVVIAIDDFGTGYSSLTYLRQLPIDTLKIAQPFVGEIGVNLHNSPGDEAIITAITNLAHSLGMRVVAEGVETEQQLEFLRRIGCDEMQGFLFSQPLPAPETEALLRSTFKNVMTKDVTWESALE
jgi:diguanylate cyclase (GGDEF)-like protein